MDKTTNNLKMDEIRRLVDSKQYKKAYSILNTMDISKIKAVTELSVYAEVLEHNEKYSEAKDLLLRIYDKSQTRRVIYCLINLFIKMNDYNEAESYLNRFNVIAPSDIDRIILRYKLDKAVKKPLEELICDLEELKNEEYIEEWSFELAKLYHKAGFKDKCVRECNDIILWFGEGTIVERARLLKEYYVGNNDKLNAFRAWEREGIERDKELLKTKDYSKEVKEINDILAENIEYEDAQVELKGEKQKDIQEIAIEKKTEKELDILTEKEPEIEPGIESNETEIEPEITELEIEAKIIEQETDSKLEKEKQDRVSTGVVDVLSQPIKVNKTDVVIATVHTDIFYENINMSSIFHGFLKVHEISNQLVDVLNKINRSDPYKHFIITGLAGCGKTNLSKKLLTAFYKLGYIKTTQIAKITGEKLNKMQLEEKADRLIGGCLIIEKASTLTKVTLEKLINIIIVGKADILVVFEDDKEAIKQLLYAYPKLKEFIPIVIDIPEYTVEELFEFAIDYFKEEEYVLEEEAKPKLKDIVLQIFSTKRPELRLSSLLNVAQYAKESAEHRNMKHLSKIVEERTYSDSDLLKIKDIDFTSLYLKKVNQNA